MEQTGDALVHFERQPGSELATDNTSYRSEFDSRLSTPVNGGLKRCSR